MEWQYYVRPPMDRFLDIINAEDYPDRLIDIKRSAVQSTSSRAYYFAVAEIVSKYIEALNRKPTKLILNVNVYQNLIAEMSTMCGELIFPETINIHGCELDICLTHKDGVTVCGNPKDDFIAYETNRLYATKTMAEDDNRPV